MSARELAERHRRLAAASLSVRLAEQGPEVRRTRLPAAGDRYTLRATAELPVEWILLERHPERAAFLAVPADTHPFLGSADLAVPASPLRLRCGAAVWLEEAALEPACHAGAIDRLTVERARQKGLAPRSEPKSDEQAEVDESPEYEDWMHEVVRPALAAAGTVAPERQPAPMPSPGLGRRPLPWAVAASILLLLSLALAVWAGWQRVEIGRLAAALNEAKAASPGPDPPGETLLIRAFERRLKAAEAEIRRLEAAKRGTETALAQMRGRRSEEVLRADQGWQGRLQEAEAELERLRVAKRGAEMALAAERDRQAEVMLRAEQALRRRLQDAEAELGRLAAAKRGAETALAEERGHQADAAVTAAKRQQQEQAEKADLRRRLAEIEIVGAKLPEARINVSFAILSPTTPGSGEEPKVAQIEPVDTPNLPVVLNLDNDMTYARYRVVLTRKGSETPVWQSDRLESKGKERRIQFLLDRRMIPPDSYHFQVFGLPGKRSEPLAEYDLVIGHPKRADSTR